VVPRLSYWLYWPLRLLAELLVVLMLLAAITQLERDGTFAFGDIGDLLRLHLLYALPVFWLARWRPWTIWITGPLWLLAMLTMVLFAASLFMAVPLYVFALGLIIFAAYRLGKAQHRKRIQ
jgi:hypothetical protein